MLKKVENDQKTIDYLNFLFYHTNSTKILKKIHNILKNKKTFSV